MTTENIGWVRWGWNACSSLLASVASPSMQRMAYGVIAPGESFSTAPEMLPHKIVEIDAQGNETELKRVSPNENRVALAANVVARRENETRSEDRANFTRIPESISPIWSAFTGMFSNTRTQATTEKTTETAVAPYKPPVSQTLPQTIVATTRKVVQWTVEHKWATASFLLLANLPGVNALPGVPTIAMSALSYFAGMTPLGQAATVAAVGTGLALTYKKAPAVVGNSSSVRISTTDSTSDPGMQPYPLIITCDNGKQFRVTVNLAKGLSEEELQRNADLWKTTVLEPLSEKPGLFAGDRFEVAFNEDNMSWSAKRVYLPSEATRQKCDQELGLWPQYNYTVKPTQTAAVLTIKRITNDPNIAKEATIQILNTSSPAPQNPDHPDDKPSGFANPGSANACWLNTSMQTFLAVEEISEAMREEMSTEELRAAVHQHDTNQEISLRELRPRGRKGKNAPPLITGAQQDVEDGYASLGNLCELPTVYSHTFARTEEGRFRDGDPRTQAQRALMTEQYPEIWLQLPEKPKDTDVLTLESLAEASLDDQTSHTYRVYERVPPFLHFKIKRFTGNDDGNRSQDRKIKTKLKAPAPLLYRLDAGHVLNPAPQNGDPLTSNTEANREFELMSYAVHAGETLNSGHWIGYGRQIYFEGKKRKDRFYRFDDTKPRDKKAEEISQLQFEIDTQYAESASLLYRQKVRNDIERPRRQLALAPLGDQEPAVN